MVCQAGGQPPEGRKVYDEKNNTYKVKTYSYEELVADDIRAIETFNAQPHPNQSAIRA